MGGREVRREGEGGWEVRSEGMRKGVRGEGVRGERSWTEVG